MRLYIVYKNQEPDSKEELLHARTNLSLIPYSEITKRRSDGYLYFSKGVLKFQLVSVPAMNSLFVSFEHLERRVKDSLFQQNLIKAVGIGRGRRPSILDGTAGLGSDAFLMASTGTSVSLVERNPIIYELLNDGLKRYKLNGSKESEISTKMHIEKRDFLELKDLHCSFDAVYLDPMFPSTKKSSLSKRPMYYLQKLLQEEVSEHDMFSVAQSIASKRVVVKRGIHSPNLAGHNADLVYRGNSSRFDVYLV